jgi:hypothetical protein
MNRLAVPLTDSNLVLLTKPSGNLTVSPEWWLLHDHIAGTI